MPEVAELAEGDTCGGGVRAFFGQEQGREVAGLGFIELSQRAVHIALHHALL